jgi:hypothetical protein
MSISFVACAGPPATQSIAQKAGMKTDDQPVPAPSVRFPMPHQASPHQAVRRPDHTSVSDPRQQARHGPASPAMTRLVSASTP